MVNWATSPKNDTWGLPQRKHYHPAFSPLSIALFRNFSLLNYTNIMRCPPELRWLSWCQGHGKSQTKFKKTIVYGLHLACLSFSWSNRGFTFHDASSLKSTKDLSHGYDCLVLAGGGYLNTVFLHELFFKLHLINSFCIAGKPVILTGQQIGPIYSPVLRTIVGKYLRRVNFIGLREGIVSPVLLKKLCVPPERFEVLGDDSFGVKSIKSEAVECFLDYNNLQDKGFIAFNFRLAGYAVTSTELLRRAGNLLLKLQVLLKKKIIYVSIAHGENDSDVAAARLLLSEYPELDMIILFDKETNTASSIKYLLKYATMAIGVSYHFCTYALSEAVPTLCLYSGEYYEQKAQGLAAFWGNPSIACSLNAPTVDIVEQAITLSNGCDRVELIKLSQAKHKFWANRVSEVIRTTLNINSTEVSEPEQITI